MDFKEKVIGNSLIAATFLNYFGPFENNLWKCIYHNHLIPLLKKKKFSISVDFSCVFFLSDDVEILDWTFNGLPYD